MTCTFVYYDTGRYKNAECPRPAMENDDVCSMHRSNLDGKVNDFLTNFYKGA